MWAEVERIERGRERRNSPGRELYHLIGFFANPLLLWDESVAGVIDDYRTSVALGVPLAATLDELPAFRSADFVVIADELEAVRAHIASMRGK